MRGNKSRGFICNECDVLNLDTEVCLSCGQRRDDHFIKPNLYIYKGIIRTAQEWADKLHCSNTTIYKKSKGQNPKYVLYSKTSRE